MNSLGSIELPSSDKTHSKIVGTNVGAFVGIVDGIIVGFNVGDVVGTEVGDDVIDTVSCGGDVSLPSAIGPLRLEHEHVTMPEE
jgi:hypothetical protein